MTTTATHTCDIDWCHATHYDNPALHLQQETVVGTVDDRLVSISAEFDETTGRHTVWVGGYRFDLFELNALIDAAGVAAQLPIPAVAR